MRLLLSVFGGLFVALSLFLLDHALITRPARPATDYDALKFVDFVRVQRDEIIKTKTREPPPKPEPPKQPPPPQKLITQAPQNTPRLPVAIDVPNIAFSGAGGSGPFLGSFSAGPAIKGDAEVIPVVRIQPRYPREALLRGLEGWVELEFTINKDGTVRGARVLDADPPRIFNQSAVRAILRWKFRPRVIDGKPVERRASQTIEFKLDEEGNA